MVRDRRKMGLSLKNLREQAQLSVICPSCGQPVPFKKISTHHVQCPGWTKARDDALHPNKKKQAEIVMQKMSLSERWGPVILDSNWVRHHWLPSFVAVALLSWLVGYTQPQGTNSFITIIVVPAVALSALGVITFLDWRGLTKRWEAAK